MISQISFKKDREMPFCPKCLSEYIHEEKICPECGIQLVPALDKSSESKGFFNYIKRILRIDKEQFIKRTERENWIELEYLYDEVSGIMIKGILENNGVRVIIEDARFSNLYKVDVKSSVNYRGVILVRKEDLERARKIISEYLKAIEESD